MRRALNLLILSLAFASGSGCSDGKHSGLEPGVVLTYPADGQLDVPTSARIVMSFTDSVDQTALGVCTNPLVASVCLVGPDGPVALEISVVGERGNVIELQTELAPGTDYQVYARPTVLGGTNALPDGEPLFSFRTRRARPHSTAPNVAVINGLSPADFALPTTAPSVPAVFDFSSLRLVFSEPINRRTLNYGTTVSLLDMNDGLVPATLLAQGVHLTIDPDTDLVAGTPYRVVVESAVTDLSGTALDAFEASFIPVDTRGDSERIPQRLVTRAQGTPGPEETRSGRSANSISIEHALVGSQTLQARDSVLDLELGDPQALGGPISIVIRRGQRLNLSPLDVSLGGAIPAGLTTGDITIHFLSDAEGVLERNPYRPGETIPDNDDSPVHVRLVMDIGITGFDETGHAVLTQSILGLRTTGIATATDGVLVIENVATMELDLLGIGRAATDMVLELVTSPDTALSDDNSGPRLIASYPSQLQSDFPAAQPLSLIFDEPIDMDSARAGGIRIENDEGAEIPSVLAQRGGAIILYPEAPLPDDAALHVVFSGVLDAAGNPIAASPDSIDFSTSPVGGTDVPATLRSATPGVPCALTSVSDNEPGRCAGGAEQDDLYSSFTVAANDTLRANFHQPLDNATVSLGDACGEGSVRVETTNAVGECTGTVPGSLVPSGRGLVFVPDESWTAGQNYRWVMASGQDATCDSGEICGRLSGDPVSFDPLRGAEDGDAGGFDLSLPFSAADASGRTLLTVETVPFADHNGSGFVDGGESPADANRAAMRVVGVNGDVTSAVIRGGDCIEETAEVEGCVYLAGHLPVAMGLATSVCSVPGHPNVDSCIPVTLFPQHMFGTSIKLESEILGIGVGIDTDTGLMVLRFREAENGEPVRGWIIDDGGSPKFVTVLRLYMDAPDMSILLSEHDLHSKEIEVTLEGPVGFFSDGRFQINLANVFAVPLTVNIDGPIVVAGSIDMEMPAGEMKLQLLSQPLRGGGILTRSTTIAIVAALWSLPGPALTEPAPAPKNRFYVRLGVTHIATLESSGNLVIEDIDGPASLGLMNGPIAGSGSAVDSSTVPGLIIGWVTPWWDGRLSIEAVLGIPFEIEFKATGTLASESLAPDALGLPTGVPPLGPEIGTTKAAPATLTAVYRFAQEWGPVQPYAGAGLAVLFAFDSKVTNPVLMEAGDDAEFSIAPAPGLVLQGGLETRVWGRFWAAADVKYVAGMLARARLSNVVVRTPEIPLFEQAEVKTAKMNVWLNPVVVQLSLGMNF